MPKVISIIERQAGRQRTPKEAIQYISDQIDRGGVTHVHIIFRDEHGIGYVPGSENRNYSRQAILWDIEQWKSYYISGDVDEEE